MPYLIFSFQFLRGPGHLQASNKPGRVALVCRVVSLRALAAFIAFHLGAELVERHRAEHRYPLAEHPERYPHRALAAFATDLRITFGLEQGNGAVAAIRASKRDAEDREMTLWVAQ
jgi:hypothetical protein